MRFLWAAMRYTQVTSTLTRLLDIFNQTHNLSMITVALPKGALLSDSIRLLQAVGLDFSAFLDKTNRQLQYF